MVIDRWPLHTMHACSRSLPSSAPLLHFSLTYLPTYLLSRPSFLTFYTIQKLGQLGSLGEQGIDLKVKMTVQYSLNDY